MPNFGFSRGHEDKGQKYVAEAEKGPSEGRGDRVGAGATAYQNGVGRDDVSGRRGSRFDLGHKVIS